MISGGVKDYSLNELAFDFRIALLRWWIGTVCGYGSAYAESWTGRQAEVARQEIARCSEAVLDYGLTELI